MTDQITDAQESRELSLREIVERHGSNLAKRQWDALLTVLVDYAMTEAGRHSRIAGLWNDDARDAVLDGLVPGRTTGPSLMTITDAQAAFPVQNPQKAHHRSTVPKAVYMKAYEVYCHVWSPQPAMIEGNCRGGFEINELVAFLYAASFPRAEWRQRVNEVSNAKGEV